MSGPLVVSDLDGTLLRGDGVLSTWARERLDALVRDGLAFSVASARSVITMRHALGGLALRLPVIAFNGTFLSDLATGTHHAVRHVEARAVGDVHDVIARHGFAPIVSTYADGVESLHHERVGNEGTRAYLVERERAADPRLRPAAPLAEALRAPVVCFLVIARHEELDALLFELDRDWADVVTTYRYENVSNPGWFWLSVHDRRATKADGVELLREHAGLAGRELIVFGDQLNDLPMLRVADRAIAMGNAHPTVKSAAHEVIGTNAEDAVVRYLEKLTLSR